MSDWSAGYELLRLYVRFAFWLSHRRIIVTGRDLIPRGKPIIFAPNHQNALMDPLALVCTNPFQTVWLARADIFKSKLAQKILKFLKLLPVYRIRDGKENLQNNEQIFEQAAQILKDNQTIALFPEAAHSGRRQMLPHKKAIPRIALESEDKNNFGLNLQIVPVGIFYSHYWHFNRTLIVRYGESIAIDNYRQEYKDNAQKAMLNLRDEIYERLRPLTMNIESSVHYEDYENIRQLAGKAFSKKHFFHKNRILQLFFAEKELINRLEKLEEVNPESFQSLIGKCNYYFKLLADAGLSENQISVVASSSFLKRMIKILVVLISFPLFAVGFILNALPFFVPRRILRRKVKNHTFLSTFNFVVGLIVFPFFYLLEALISGLLTGSWMISAGCFLVAPFAGKLSWNIFEFYQTVLVELRIILLTGREKATVKDLIIQNRKLTRMVLSEIDSL